MNVVSMTKPNVYAVIFGAFLVAFADWLVNHNLRSFLFVSIGGSILGWFLINLFNNMRIKETMKGDT